MMRLPGKPGWLVRHRPHWWPERLCTNQPFPWVIAAALSLGFVTSWMLNHQPPPWIEFGHLTATYRLGTTAIRLVGSHEINEICAVPPIWRVEALATDGQVAVYGPRPKAPNVTQQGEHVYLDDLQLTESILPDGWQVRIIATCPGRSPETVASEPARVRVLDDADILPP